MCVDSLKLQPAWRTTHNLHIKRFSQFKNDRPVDTFFIHRYFCRIWKQDRVPLWTKSCTVCVRTRERLKLPSQIESFKKNFKDCLRFLSIDVTYVTCTYFSLHVLMQLIHIYIYTYKGPNRMYILTINLLFNDKTRATMTLWHKHNDNDEWF